MQHLGPLNGAQTPPTEDEVSLFRMCVSVDAITTVDNFVLFSFLLTVFVLQRLIPILEELLGLPDEPKAITIRSITVNCVINTPYICTPLFNPERVLPALLHLLQVHSRDEKYAFA